VTELTKKWSVALASHQPTPELVVGK